MLFFSFFSFLEIPTNFLGFFFFFWFLHEEFAAAEMGPQELRGFFMHPKISRRASRYYFCSQRFAPACNWSGTVGHSGPCACRKDLSGCIWCMWECSP